MVKYKKILLYGQGNGRDHINHIELMKSKGIQVISLIKNENALMEQYENMYGPLVISSNSLNTTPWAWVSSFPWEVNK